MNRQRLRRHRLENLLQTLLILLGLALLLGFMGWLFAGRSGVVLTFCLVVAIGLFGPRLSPRMILRLYRSRPIRVVEAPDLHAMLTRLSERAGLPRSPQLHYVPSPVLNAFALGRRQASYIALTDGLLRNLPATELAGVLAHEISHIRNGDIRVMALADLVSRFIGLLSQFGLFVLILSLPLFLMGGTVSTWWLALMAVLLAPIGSALLQRALSRSREFDADQDAAELTGNPRWLAAALERMELIQNGWFERVLFPGRQVPDPSLLRTHPPTQDRVRRLLHLAPQSRPMREPEESTRGPFAEAPLARPRWRISGIWY